MDREPLTESEKRFVVTQVLMASSISIERLVQLFIELNELPRWDHIYLPSGRTLQECRATFEALCKPVNSPLAYTSSSTTGASTPTDSPLNKRKSGSRAMDVGNTITFESKRRLSGAKTIERSAPQHILPKPSPGDPSSGATNFFTTAPMLKRRGRPPKAEIERRQQEAVARGEVIVPQLMENPSTIQAQVSTKTVGYMSGYVPIAPAPPETNPSGLIGSRSIGQNKAESGPTTPRRAGPSLTTDNNTSPKKYHSERQFPFNQLAPSFGKQGPAPPNKTSTTLAQGISGPGTQIATKNILPRLEFNERSHTHK